MATYYMNRIFNYTRRASSVANAAGIGIGGDNPIRLQSMTNTSTLDTEACVSQTLAIVEAGGEIVRLTTQGEREAANMAAIKQRLLELGCRVPLVADVHFNPKAAYKAAETCDKVRINPGNFADPGRVFQKLEFTDEEYAAEIEKIRVRLVPFLDLCKKRGVCVRLGVNHGSLSDRIMSRYGDTPAGMVESVMEFLRICREEDFSNLVISVKASNVVVMVETVRLLVAAMEAEDMYFPLHLGVTEAGDGEDGRVKSAVGIGTLLAEGLGDTIRVSLTEDPEREIPVARLLRDYITVRAGHEPIAEPEAEASYPARAMSDAIAGFEHLQGPLAYGEDVEKEGRDFPAHSCDAAQETELFEDGLPVVLESRHANPVGEMASRIERFVAAGGKNPIILKRYYADSDPDTVAVKAAADFGALLLHGYGAGIWLDAPALTPEKRRSIELAILQATRLRISRTEYIACPGCGRTLFDLQSTLRQVREATSHLKGLKIGVMGCVVNGLGEMADADYGYVGAGPGRVSLYKGKELKLKNIPTAEALPALLALIAADRK